MATKSKALKGRGSDADFIFTTSLVDDEGNAVVITVPSLAKAEINEFKLQLLREQSVTKATGYALRATLGADADKLMLQLAELPAAESREFQEAWAAHSGVSQGES
jgi:hypothetical protein